MNKEDIDVGALRTLIHQLRVPELRYAASNAPVVGQIDSHQMLAESLQVLGTNTEHSSITECLYEGSNARQRPLLLNSAFVVDRIFDVWLRKNSLNPELNTPLSHWRYTLIFVVIKLLNVFESGDSDEEKVKLMTFLDNVDELAGALIGWHPLPERSKQAALDFIGEVSSHLLSSNFDSSLAISGFSERLNDYKARQQERFGKVVSRLIAAETLQIKNQYSYWCAQNYVNYVFKTQKLPASVQNFLDNYWVNCLTIHLKEFHGDKPYLDQESVEVTLLLLDIFCRQSDALFENADTIIVRLKEKLQSAGLQADKETWDALETSLVFLLKQELGESYQDYQPTSVIGEFAAHLSDFTLDAVLPPNTDSGSDSDKPESVWDQIFNKEASIAQGRWYDLRDQSDSFQPVYLADIFEFSGMHLFVNHVGMKVGLYSTQEVKQLLRQGELKEKADSERFVKVFSAVVKGLGRVAETQQKQRLAAAEKARKEAEKLLQEQKLAEEEAAKRASEIEQKRQEIAQRTQEMLKKREEKKRAEQESAALLLVQKLSVGAWVEIITESEPRFKLVVKIAASGKYIFVDKLGIRKKEYIEADLVSAIAAKEINCLSDGSDFEDSLQRVVSRIRVSQ